MNVATTTTVQVGGKMHKQSVKCACGDYACLTLKNKKGRHYDSLITVKNVPVYFCENCNESFMLGKDSRHFSEQVKKAALLNTNIILFNERIH